MNNIITEAEANKYGLTTLDYGVPKIENQKDVEAFVIWEETTLKSTVQEIKEFEAKIKDFRKTIEGLGMGGRENLKAYMDSEGLIQLDVPRLRRSVTVGKSISVVVADDAKVDKDYIKMIPKADKEKIKTRYKLDNIVVKGAEISEKEFVKINVKKNFEAVDDADME